MVQQYLISDSKSYLSNEFKISVQNRAFRFGDGLFETMKCANHEVLFLKDHLERLSQGLEVLKIEKHTDLNIKRFSQIVKQLCNLNHSKHLRIRLSVFRHEGGLYTPISNRSHYILEGWPIDSPYFELNKAGGSVILFTEYTKQLSAFSNFKNLNTSLYSLAGLKAKEHGTSDAIILSNDNTLCEATSSNVFLYKNSQLYTPPLSTGCVNGIMRKQIFKLCHELKIDVIEEELKPEALLQADEVFLTNAIRGIYWIKNFKSKVFTNEITQKLTKELNQLVH